MYHTVLKTNGNAVSCIQLQFTAISPFHSFVNHKCFIYFDD